MFSKETNSPREVRRYNTFSSTQKASLRNIKEGKYHNRTGIIDGLFTPPKNGARNVFLYNSQKFINSNLPKSPKNDSSTINIFDGMS